MMVFLNYNKCWDMVTTALTAQYQNEIQAMTNAHGKAHDEYAERNY